MIKQLGELKSELGQLRIQKITSSGSKLNKMYVNRVSAAKRTPPDYPIPLDLHQGYINIICPAMGALV